MEKIKYYLLQWTWGLPMNLLGAIVFIAAQIFGWRTYSWRKAVCIVVPFRYFSAMNLGMFIVRGKAYEHSLPHEYGHSIQNIKFGWSFLFVIGLPSLFRSIYYSFYNTFIYKYKRKSLPDYYSVWFENQANEYGARAKNGEWNWL